VSLYLNFLISIKSFFYTLIKVIINQLIKIICQVILVSLFRLLSESQFGPYIYHFDLIEPFFFKLSNFVPFQIHTQFHFYINVIKIFLLKLIILLIFLTMLSLFKFTFYIKFNFKILNIFILNCYKI